MGLFHRHMGGHLDRVVFVAVFAYLGLVALPLMTVDDEEQIVRMKQELLGNLGNRVTAFTSSVDALQTFQAQASDFDLVIMDMTVPQMKGDMLAKQLLASRDDIPIILCTGFSDIINHEKGIGIREYVMKPIIRHEIARTIRKVLDGE